MLREGDAAGGVPSLAFARKAAECALVALLALAVARLIWVIFTPLGPLGQPSGPSAPPVRADLAVLARFDPFHRGVAATVAPVADTSGLRLYGVRAGADGGSAIIAGADGVQKPFRIGEAIASGVTLQSVAGDHVVLVVNGRPTSLAFAPASQNAPAGSPPSAPSAPFILPAPAAAADVASVASQFQPRIQDGKVNGFAVANGGGPLAGAGLQPGDVVVSLNGKPLTGTDTLGAELANSSQATIEYERGGERRTATLRMPRP
jgi:general secretion pathway protein C